VLDTGYVSDGRLFSVREGSLTHAMLRQAVDPARGGDYRGTGGTRPSDILVGGRKG